MKLWLSIRHVLNYPNSHRPFPRNTLHLRYCYSLLIRGPHLSRRKLRLTNSQPPRQRSFLLLYLHLPAYRTGALLRLLPLQRSLKRRSSSSAPSNDNCFRRLRPTLRTNVFLRGHSHYQPTLRCPIRRKRASAMNLRGLLRR